MFENSLKCFCFILLCSLEEDVLRRQLKILYRKVIMVKIKFFLDLRILFVDFLFLQLEVKYNEVFVFDSIKVTF